MILALEIPIGVSDQSSTLCSLQMVIIWIDIVFVIFFVFEMILKVCMYVCMYVWLACVYIIRVVRVGREGGRGMDEMKFGVRWG